MVIARGDVCDKRPQDIEGRLMADALLEPDVHLDLVEGDVAWPFDHDLDSGVPGFLDKLTESEELLDLGAIGGVDDRARAESITKAQGDIVAAGKVKETVIIGIEGVLGIVMEHPSEMEGSSSGDDVGDTLLLLEAVDGFLGEAAVYRHEIDALLGLSFDGGEEIVDGHFHYGPVAIDGLNRGLVNWDGAQGERRVCQDAPADTAEVASRAEVHDSVGFVIQGDIDLAELVGELREVGRCADIDVDLGAEGTADGCGSGRGVLGIEGDDYAAGSNQGKEGFQGSLFRLSHFPHGVRKASLASALELCHFF